MSDMNNGLEVLLPAPLNALSYLTGVGSIGFVEGGKTYGIH